MMFQASCAVRDSLSATGMGMVHPGGAGGQVGLGYASPLGMLEANVQSQGPNPSVVELALRGFQPLSFMQLSPKLAFMHGMLVGGEVETMLMPPLVPGMMKLNASLDGRLSGEFFTGAQPPTAPGHTVMLGAHVWGFPGIFGGVKAAIEWQREVVVDEELESHCAVTATMTRPYLMNDGAPGVPSYSLAVCNRLSFKPETTLVMQMELTAFKPKFGLVKMKGESYVDGNKVLEGDFQFAMIVNK